MVKTCNSKFKTIANAIASPCHCPILGLFAVLGLVPGPGFGPCQGPEPGPRPGPGPRPNPRHHDIHMVPVLIPVPVLD